MYSLDLYLELFNNEMFKIGFISGALFVFIVLL